MLPVLVWTARGERTLQECELPLPLERLIPGDGPWEVELGFGKGRHLLRSAERAAATPGDHAPALRSGAKARCSRRLVQALDRPRGVRTRRYLGLEVASKYYRLVRERADRRGLENVLLIRGEAEYTVTVALPPGFADVLHIYFPDPWPKSRHQRRRLLGAASIDLMVGLLRPGGQLCFATDYLDYGEEVAALVLGHPALAGRRLAEPWPGGPRTNYEAKYVREGRPILRLEAVRRQADAAELLHPHGRGDVVCAWRPVASGSHAGRGDAAPPARRTRRPDEAGSGGDTGARR